MTEQMAKVGEALFSIAKCHNKGYCFASQKTLNKLLEKYQHWNLSERTLRRRLKDLVDQGYFKVVHRNWSEVNGSKKFRTNLYTPQRKWFEWLQKGVRFARKVFSFFRRPKMANYSSPTEKRDINKDPETVEILWKTDKKGRASPIQGIL